MPTPGEFHLRFVPRGVSDTIDGDNSPAGACTSLSNLIFDPSTPGVLLCRPAAIQLSSFPGFAGPGVISVAYPLNGLVYGMVKSTRNAGHDEPFVYNVVTNAFIAVGGTINAASTPATQPLTGAWTPPTMDLCGSSLIVTHPGFPGGAGAYFGWFDISNPAAPVWHAGNTTTNALPAVPQAVRQFSNRAWFAVGNAAYFTDALTLTITNATQILILGDSTIITALAPMPLGTTSQAILQGLIAFKANSAFQITGDAVTSNLSENQLSTSVGTAAPRSPVATPEGVYFMALDGLRKIGFDGRITQPNNDLALPFIYASVPSRVSAAYNSNIYRICVQNSNALNAPYQEYWYDLRREGWTGPHTFRHDMAVPYANDFILFSNALPATLWSSDVVQGHLGGGSSFTENGVALSWLYQTPPMTDVDNLYGNSILKSTVEMGLPGSGDSYLVTGQDMLLGVQAQGTIMAPASTAVWNAFTWGAALWGATQYGLRPVIIPWTNVLVFNKLTVAISGPSSLNLKIGGFHFLYERLKYMLQ